MKILLLITAFIFSLNSFAEDKAAEKPTEPTVEIQKIRIKQMGFTETTLEFDALVANPSAVEIDVNAFDYELSLDGEQFPKADYKLNVKIKGNHKGTIKVPLEVANADLFKSLAKITQNPKTPYKIKGSVTVNKVKVPFEDEGTLDTDELIKQ